MNAITTILLYKYSECSAAAARPFLQADCEKNAVQSAPVTGYSGSLCYCSVWTSATPQGRTIYSPSLHQSSTFSYSTTHYQEASSHNIATTKERPTSVSNLPAQTMLVVCRTIRVCMRMLTSRRANQFNNCKHEFQQRVHQPHPSAAIASCTPILLTVYTHTPHSIALETYYALAQIPLHVCLYWCVCSPS